MDESIQDMLHGAGLELVETERGLALTDGSLSLCVDFSDARRRIAHNALHRELLVRATKLKIPFSEATLLDATAGLGDDSFLLAAAGFSVQLYERNPVIAALLKDGVERARADTALHDIALRMSVHEEDSVAALRSGDIHPDVVYLDPMFPERKKSAAVKKKFQLLQRLEAPCDDAQDILNAAIEARPRKIVIKRPAKGPYLGDRTPDYSLRGKAVRYDCHVFA